MNIIKDKSKEEIVNKKDNSTNLNHYCWSKTNKDKNKSN